MGGELSCTQVSRRVLRTRPEADAAAPRSRQKAVRPGALVWGRPGAAGQAQQGGSLSPPHPQVQVVGQGRRGRRRLLGAVCLYLRRRRAILPSLPGGRVLPQRGRRHRLLAGGRGRRRLLRCRRQAQVGGEPEISGDQRDGAAVHSQLPWRHPAPFRQPLHAQPEASQLSLSIAERTSSSSSAAFFPLPFLNWKRRSRFCACDAGRADKRETEGEREGEGHIGMRQLERGRGRAGRRRPRAHARHSEPAAGRPAAAARQYSSCTARLYCPARLIVLLPLGHLLLAGRLVRLLRLDVLLNLQETRGRRGRPTEGDGARCSARAVAAAQLDSQGAQGASARHAGEVVLSSSHVQDAVLAGTLDEHEDALALRVDALAPVGLRAGRGGSMGRHTVSSGGMQHQARSRACAR